MKDWLHPSTESGAPDEPGGYQDLQPISAFLPLRAVIILLLPVLLWVFHISIRYPAVLWATFILALLSLPGSYLLERRGQLQDRGFRWVLPVIDFLMIVLLHQGSSGAASAFFPLFYVPIAYAGLLSGYWGGLLAALGASVAYSFLYLLNPQPERGWIVLSIVLLFPVAGLVSGYMGQRFDRLNAMGRRLLSEAKRVHQQVEDRRVLYERWYRAVDRLKADFVYSVSHELRTPLTPVKGYLQLLTDPALDIPLEKRMEYLQVMMNNVNLLAQLVDDVIYLQRVTRIPIDLEGVDLAQTARQALDEVIPEAEESGVQLQFDEKEKLPAVLGSSGSLKLVIVNLLESIIADSPPGSRVDLSLAPLGEEVVVRISGEGQGTPVENQERMFDLFFHADSSPTYVLGREGLKLSISRYIVEMHGGRIAVENPSRGGIVFVIHFPSEMRIASDAGEGILP